MNAFMWFMKENRPKIMEEEEWKDKQSAELNKVRKKGSHSHSHCFDLEDKKISIIL